MQQISSMWARSVQFGRWSPQLMFRICFKQLLEKWKYFSCHLQTWFWKAMSSHMFNAQKYVFFLLSCCQKPFSHWLEAVFRQTIICCWLDIRHCDVMNFCCQALFTSQDNSRETECFLLGKLFTEHLLCWISYDNLIYQSKMCAFFSQFFSFLVTIKYIILFMKRKKLSKLT